MDLGLGAESPDRYGTAEGPNPNGMTGTVNPGFEDVDLGNGLAASENDYYTSQLSEEISEGDNDRIPDASGNGFDSESRGKGFASARDSTGNGFVSARDSTGNGFVSARDSIGKGFVSSRDSKADEFVSAKDSNGNSFVSAKDSIRGKGPIGENLVNGKKKKVGDTQYSGDKDPVPRQKTMTQDDTSGDGKSAPLKRFLTLKHFVAMLVSLTGNSAIFFTPGPTLLYSGSVGFSLIIWFVSGILNLALALCYTEVGTLFPEAGGAYAYVVRTFGSLPGFITMWGYSALVICPVWALMAYITALYIVQPFFPDCDPPLLGVKLLATFILITSAGLNCVYVKYIAKVQMFLSATKLLALLLIIIGGIYSMAMGDTENFKQPFEGTITEPGQIALAIFAAYYSYGGWQVITNVVEESKRPEVDLPRSVYISFFIIISTFCLTNMAYFALLSKQDILNSQAVAVLYTSRLYPPLTAVISVLVVISSFGALNAVVLGQSRWLFAAGRIGHMPSFVGMVHKKYATPWPSLIILSAITLLMLFIGEALVLIEYTSLASIIVSLEVFAVLFYFRLKKNSRKPSYQVNTPLAVSMVLVNVAVLVLGIYQKPVQMGIALAIIFSGLPVYWVGITWKHKPKTLEKFLKSLTTAVRCTLDLRKAE